MTESIETSAGEHTRPALAVHRVVEMRAPGSRPQSTGSRDSVPPTNSVRSDHGNNGEGARSGTTFGPYLHDPLRLRKAWFADGLIATALAVEQPALLPCEPEDIVHLRAWRP